MSRNSEQMKIVLLALAFFLILAASAVSHCQSLDGRLIVRIQNEQPLTCECTETTLLAALKQVLEFTPPPFGITSEVAIYKSPSTRLREEADRLERQQFAYDQAQSLIEICDKTASTRQGKSSK